MDLFLLLFKCNIFFSNYSQSIIEKDPTSLMVGSVSSRECLDAPAILATLKVARIAGASRHSRLETEPSLMADCTFLRHLVSTSESAQCNRKSAICGLKNPIGQSSRSLAQTKRIVGSGDEIGFSPKIHCSLIS